MNRILLLVVGFGLLASGQGVLDYKHVSLSLNYRPFAFQMMQSIFSPTQASTTITNLDKEGSQCAAECASNTHTKSLDAAAGSFVIVNIFTCASGCAVTPVDGDLTSIGDGTNTYVDDGFCNYENYGIWQYHIVSAAGGSLTITATFGAGKAWYSGILWSNFTGSGTTLDEIACNHAGSGTAPSVTTSGNLDASNELLHGIAVGHSSIAAGATYTPLVTTVNGVETEFKQGGTSGATATADWTQTSAAWNAMIATYKP